MSQLKCVIYKLVQLPKNQNLAIKIHGCVHGLFGCDFYFGGLMNFSESPNLNCTITSPHNYDISSINNSPHELNP